jgi:acyl-CoA synthetase (AMP-forming)/AMP-acid ligase II
MPATLLPDPDVLAAATLPAPRALPAELLLDRALRVAGWLREQGVAPGDRVAIQLENGLDLVDAHLGCIALGAVRVPLNGHYRVAELAPIVEDAAPTLVIARDPSLYADPSRVRPSIATGAPLANPSADLALALGLDPSRRAAILSGAEPAAQATAWLFTSGTTGRP